MRDARTVPADTERELARAERLLKIAQVALLANETERTVRRHIVKGALAVIYVGPHRRPRVRLSEARRYAGLG